MEHGSWLTGGLVYLGAAVIAVPVAKKLGLGSIIGYLAAGILIGPWGLRLVTDPQDMLHFAEFGVVLMLFLVGLELEPKRLWSLRKPIFGWGSAQLFGSAALLLGAAVAAGVPWQLAVVGGLGLAMSSTAIGLGVLGERNLMATTSGQSLLSVALLQDIAAIPILALVPLLAAASDAPEHGSFWLGAAKALGVIAIIVLGGRLLLRPTLRWIAGSATPEIFTAASLLLVLATAALMQTVGLSMALGAFLAGVLLAESEYRRELETDIEPFKGLLLGLFFIAVGMSIDFSVVMQRPLLVALIVGGFLAVKAAVLWAMGRAMPLPKAERPVFIILLAQGGEFGFVVFQTAAQAGVIDAPTSSLLVAAVALSMLLTPLLLVAADRWWTPTLAGQKRNDIPELSEQQNASVIIAGFGRYGQIVGRMMFANGLTPTVLEHDAEALEALRRFGWPVFYGDATRLDLLRTAGAATAKVLVLAIDDVEQSVEVATLVRENFPQLTIVARARNVRHYYRLRELGVTLIERETLDSALMTARSALELLGWQPHQARNLALRFRRHSIDQLEAMRPHARDQERLIAVAKEGRQQLETLFAQERAAALDRKQRAGWGGAAEKPEEETT
ncbi:glutathione-regulated potassium-efflux system protein KefC [Rhizobacter sp. SG703]|uniref:glutathione-regulated potassium-efflux system protein KefC n=1 Tax=Rhizobacter sp. SG703 TaxID=2587140 RepID=UPI0014479BEB|nr:glutathione-regulated potassium-efflux system protein KefC [Rhizobacter sp. SG703]NKI97379.1 glutathione-regulated potassium-efflux system ancillary protein KefC [Rhizobacter sp. SG703]